MINLIKAVRQEEMVILDILAQSHLLSPKERHDLKIRLKSYLDSIKGNENVTADNLYYDELLRFTKQEKFKDNQVMDVIYGRLAKTQENRDNLSNLYKTKLFSHEWLVVTVLFAVTLYFSMQTDYGDSLFFRIMLAVLCTGITMLMVILIKYATLTHKLAKRIWEPLHTLDRDHFEDVDHEEVALLARKLRSGLV